MRELYWYQNEKVNHFAVVVNCRMGLRSPNVFLTGGYTTSEFHSGVGMWVLVRVVLALIQRVGEKCGGLWCCCYDKLSGLG